MHLYKSTERHLAMLKIPFGVKNKLGKKALSSSNFNPLYLNGNKEPTGITNRPYFFRTSGIIRCKKIQARPLSNLTTDNIPLLNPNKPGPAHFKDQVSEPIVPVTLPRFPKTDYTLPSVTKILQATMPAASQFILDRWKETMIKKLGLDGFSKYQQDTFERGRILHSLIANYLLGQGSPTDISKDVVANLWKSIESVVKENITNVRLVEHVVTHSDMKYRGIVDCVAFYKDELCVIDFKTAEKPKKSVESLYDNPLQVTAYCGAINNDKKIPYNVIDRNICAALVIVAYIDGSDASVYYLGRDKIMNDYWQQWKRRLSQYSSLEAMKKTQEKEKPKKITID